MEIQPNKNDPDFWVQQGFITCGDALVILRIDVSPERGVCAADEGDVLGVEFLLDAGFADDEDLALVGWEVKDAGDID